MKRLVVAVAMLYAATAWATCQTFSTQNTVDDGVDNGYVETAGDPFYPPGTPSTGGSGYGFMARTKGAGPSFNIAVGMFRWDTSTFVGTPVSGQLLFTPIDYQNTDNLTVTCECFDWSPAVTVGNYTEGVVPATFVSIPMSSLAIGVPATITLTGVACVNNVAGHTYVRCTMSQLAADAPPTGENSLDSFGTAWQLQLCTTPLGVAGCCNCPNQAACVNSHAGACDDPTCTFEAGKVCVLVP